MADYGGHFQHVLQNLHESDDLRVLDEDGQRAFRLFRLKELAEPVMLRVRSNDIGRRRSVNGHLPTGN